MTAVELTKNKVTHIRQVKNKSTQEVTNALVKMLLPFKEQISIITVDNGKEFAHHKKIADALNTEVYFAHPYCSWKESLMKNTNGLIWQYFPKNSIAKH